MEEMQMENTQAESTKIEGRNAVLEAFRSGHCAWVPSPCVPSQRDCVTEIIGK